MQTVGEDHDREQHVRRRHRGRPLDRGDRGVDDGARGSARRAMIADRRQPAEPAREDRRPERIADHDDADLDQGRRVRRRRSPRRRSHATPTRPISMPSRPDRGRTGPRRRSRARARCRPAGRRRSAGRPASSRCAARPTRARPTGSRSRPPRMRRPSANARGPAGCRPAASAIGSRIAAAMRRPPEHQQGRRDLRDGDPDEQVRDAPDDRHQGEQDQRAAAHDGSRSSISQAWSMTWWAVRRMRNWIGHVRAGLPSAL